MKRQVFFDLDETLISCKSLLEVFKYYCANTCFVEFRDRYFSVVSDMKEMVLNGVDRNQINRFFYENFRGISRSEMQRLASDWFYSRKSDSDFFYLNVVNELNKHQAAGDDVILVSGSFAECVGQIASYLSVKDYMCINLECVNDLYTGNITGEQTIGDGKRRAIENFVTQRKLSLKGSYAYGDHESDLSMFLMVENPVAVGVDGALLKHAKINSWKIIPY